MTGIRHHCRALQLKPGSLAPWFMVELRITVESAAMGELRRTPHDADSGPFRASWSRLAKWASRLAP